MKALRFHAPLYPVALVMAVAAAFLMTGCASTHTPGPTVYKEVPVPYHAPCPKPGDKPALPKRVAAEHPVMPADHDARERILAAKVLEWIGYGDQADAVMTACSK